MGIELTMPALSPTMETGTLAKWLVSAGDFVKAGDVIAEIETDKATMEFEVADEGRIAELLVPEGGEDIAVGTAIAVLAAEGETVPQPVTAERASIAAPAQSPAPSPAPPPALAPAPAALATAVADVEPSFNATPLARRIAGVNGIALASLTGSGANGKIVKADLGLPRAIAPAQSQPAPAAISNAANLQPPEGVPRETVKLNAMRKTIAQRLTHSKQQIPHFYLTARCNIDPLLDLRGQLNAQLESQDIRVSVNDMMLKAMAMALTAVPEANVQFGGDVLHRFSQVDISMAVAVEGGLITPVVRGADSLSLIAISQRARELAELARAGRLDPQDYQGGTASLSNLGMFGIDEMFPVINPPQSLILGVAAGVRQPWNVDGTIELATIMSVTASFDHRAIDGSTAANFMKVMRNMIESPLLIMA